MECSCGQAWCPVGRVVCEVEPSLFDFVMPMIVIGHAVGYNPRTGGHMELFTMEFQCPDLECGETHYLRMDVNMLRPFSGMLHVGSRRKP